MAMTANSDINKYAINKFSQQFGENGSFRLVNSDEMKNPKDIPKEGLFSHTDNYLTLAEVTRNYPSIQEIDIEDKTHYKNLIDITNKDKDIIPLFVKDNEGELHIISSFNKHIDDIKEGSKLIYLGKPFDIENLLHIIRNLKETIRLKRENEDLKSKLYKRHQFHNIIGKSSVMQKIFNLLETVSDTESTVLISGETGTGKELIAEAIHYNSRHHQQPLIAVSCAALPQGLLESELFGHEKGAFTGAVKQKKGRFELANNGTLFY